MMVLYENELHRIHSSLIMKFCHNSFYEEPAIVHHGVKCSFFLQSECAHDVFSSHTWFQR